MSETVFELSVEVKELPIELIVENMGQIEGVPKNPRKISREKFKCFMREYQGKPRDEST